MKAEVAEKPSAGPASKDAGLTRSQQAATNFLATIAMLAIFLAVMEVVSFFAMKILRASFFEQRPGQRMSAAYKGQSWAPALAREEKASRIYDYQPYTIWRSKGFHGDAVNIDAGGIRRTAHSHCDANEFTIWTFGGSTMRGNGSPDWGTIPSQLAELFEKAGQP